jgi:hypothetical protein
LGVWASPIRRYSDTPTR